MTNSQSISPINIEVTPALPEQQSILANLLELYVYDFSEFLELHLGADGRFGYEQLPLYWKETNRYPFLIKVNGYLAGFVFVHKGSQISGDENVWDMAQFFILHGYRRLGIGKQVAHEIWQRFPGIWEVRVIARNQKAKIFWERAIAEFTGKAIESVSFDKAGENWHLFSFESTCAA
jgi:predicted acetyltransferase